MKSNHLALLFVFVAGVAAGTLFYGTGERRATAQDQPDGAPEAARDTTYAESELKLTVAQLEYATSANERLGGGIYPATLIKQLELKQQVIETFIAEQQKAEPDMQAVLIKKAEARLEIAKLRYESELIEGKKALHAIAIDVAEKRLERVRSGLLKDHERQQDWQIGQVQLDLLNLRIDLDLIK